MVCLPEKAFISTINKAQEKHGPPGISPAALSDLKRAGRPDRSAASAQQGQVSATDALRPRISPPLLVVYAPGVAHGTSVRGYNNF